MPPKIRDLIKLVEADGWRLKDQPGSHRQYVHPTKPGQSDHRRTPVEGFHRGHLPEYSQTSGVEKMNDYLIILETSATGWGAYTPDLPGVVAAGETFEETEQLIREALEIHLESMLVDGDVIPAPTTRSLTMRPKVLTAQLAKSA